MRSRVAPMFSRCAPRSRWSWPYSLAVMFMSSSMRTSASSSRPSDSRQDTHCRSTGGTLRCTQCRLTLSRWVRMSRAAAWSPTPRCNGQIDQKSSVVAYGTTSNSSSSIIICARRMRSAMTASTSTPRCCCSRARLAAVVHASWMAAWGSVVRERIASSTRPLHTDNASVSCPAAVCASWRLERAWRSSPRHPASRRLVTAAAATCCASAA
mmetsp:Transcript_32183/g.75570  ORF Transcript_32183/g.75570 Transcript_32183/m.75570 type:complete len:211 (+) Transcript_32183:749-1381(+)